MADPDAGCIAVMLDDRLNSDASAAGERNAQATFLADTQKRRPELGGVWIQCRGLWRHLSLVRRPIQFLKLGSMRSSLRSSGGHTSRVERSSARSGLENNRSFLSITSCATG